MVSVTAVAPGRGLFVEGITAHGLILSARRKPEKDARQFQYLINSPHTAVGYR
ncbi:hypothetical protein ACFXDJ_14915 [Streptomyces sp. NPDC059443]|uniref:hypothetical protein n=1 Tax=unclassified Streptomyces TaxID=2593676 RepID=UPI00367B3F6F